jgi:hypothetical protein
LVELRGLLNIGHSEVSESVHSVVVGLLRHIGFV